VRVDGQKLGIRRERRTSGRLTAKSISIKDAKRRSGDCARKAAELTPGGLSCVARATEVVERQSDRRAEVSRGRSRSSRLLGNVNNLSASAALNAFGGQVYGQMAQSSAYFSTPGIFTIIGRHPGETIERAGAAVALGACLLAPGCKEGTLGVIGAIGGTAGASGAAGHEIYKWLTGANPD